jgi:hypothetical protein
MLRWLSDHSETTESGSARVVLGWMSALRLMAWKSLRLWKMKTRMMTMAARFPRHSQRFQEWQAGPLPACRLRFA